METSVRSIQKFYLLKIEIQFYSKGYGHAFLNLNDEDASLLYLVETEHSPRNDTGVKWNSVDFEWPIINPILSERDENLPEISNFTPI